MSHQTTNFTGLNRPLLPADDADLRRYVKSVTVAALAATVTYLYLLGGLLQKRVFGNFYDLQARALLHGRIDVPNGSLGIEAFLNDGKSYLYFPPGPALLRMPLLAVTDRFDGRLTPLSMLLAWVLTVTLVALLMWRVRRMIRPDAHLSRLEAVGYGFMLLAGTAGSVVLFLGSIPWVYHEAYAWAIAMALGFAFCLLGVVQRPTVWGVVATGAFTAGAVLSRTTAGWACAAAILLAAVFLPRRYGAEQRHLALHLWLAGVVPILIGIAVNWAKFRHPYLFPINQQVFTSLSAHRREAIAANGGDLFSPNMIWSTLVNYFRPDGIRFVSIFPYITLPARIPPSYGGGFIDQANRTGSVVDFAPLLFGLSVWGVVATLRPGAREALRRLRLPMLGLGGIPLGIMFYAYIAHRYTSEFAPLLVLGGAVGFVEMARHLEGRSAFIRRAAFGGVAVLALFSVAASVAAALNTQALFNPGKPVLTDYVARQVRFSGWTGHRLDAFVAVSSELPPNAPADRLQIIGDCDSYFLGSGDEFHPWTEIGTRDLVYDITPPNRSGARAQAVELAQFVGHRTTALNLESDQAGRFRLTIVGGGLDLSTGWLDSGGQPMAVGVSRATLNGYRIDLTQGQETVGLDFDRETYDADWRWLPNVLVPASPDELKGSASGPTVERRTTPPLAVCEELLRRHHG